MPKMKTSKSAAKRFKVTGTGKLKRSKAYKQHILTKKTTKRKRTLRQPAITDATNLKVDFGGGLKTDDDLKKAFEAGASMVTIGSIAVTKPELFLSWLEEYGADKLILGADVRNGKISINGWKEDSAEELLPFLKQYVDHGVKNVLCTEISKDGTMQGPAIELYRQIMDAYPTLHLIASGGVGCTNDIRNLNESGIPAVVFGKAFYEGKINIEELWQL